MTTKIRSSFIAALTLLIVAAAPMMASDLADASTDASGIYFFAKSAQYGYELIVGSPDGTVSRQTFTGGQSPAFQLSGDDADGGYHWELKTIAAPRDRNQDQPAAVQGRSQSGAFYVAGGAIVTGGEEAPNPVADAAPGAKAQVFTTDLITQGSACVGIDCTSSESFGFDTLRLKENNLRIKFDDTSASASFPNNDWQLTANDSSNGGANRFSIDDITNGKTPFNVEANAPTNTLYVEDDGDVGVGTNSPVVRMHLVKGDSPTLRLEQNGSSGFTPQTWDLAGNETNFFVRDVTNGSKLPFRIKPGAPTDAVYVAANGDIGVGTDAPSEPIHVLRTDGTATIRVEDTNASSADVTLLNLRNAGTARFVLNNTLASSYRFTSAGNGDLVINSPTNGTNPLTLTQAGNLTVTGTVTPMSDRNAKENFENVDNAEVLDRLLRMPITRWNYIADNDDVRHLGPMAQDFFQSFGLGNNDKGISVTDSAGVTFAAIQALHTELTEKTEEVDSVKARNQELEARIEALEKMVQAIANAN